MTTQNTETKPLALLRPVRFEVSTKRGYVWRDGYQVVSPAGELTSPYMSRREARAYCAARGWRCEEGRSF